MILRSAVVSGYFLSEAYVTRLLLQTVTSSTVPDSAAAT